MKLSIVHRLCAHHCNLSVIISAYPPRSQYRNHKAEPYEAGEWGERHFDWNKTAGLSVAFERDYNLLINSIWRTDNNLNIKCEFLFRFFYNFSTPISYSCFPRYIKYTMNVCFLF